MDDAALEVSTEELREFLDADRLVVRADPAFKERLRRKLWAIVNIGGDGKFGGDEEL